MAGKWALGMMTVITVVAVAGIGFAAYNATASVNITTTAGSFYLQGTGTLTASSTAVGACTSGAGPSGTISLYGTDMLPGDYCNWTVAFTDAGSLPGAFVSWVISGTSPGTGPGCSQFWVYGYAPWIVDPYVTTTVSPGGTAASFWWNETDIGTGTVSGSCAWTGTLTESAT
jgi:hypothetical protein